MKLTILYIGIGLVFTSCKKTPVTETTIINGTVISASTQQLLPNVKVILSEQTSGFPFAGSSIVATTETDANGSFYFSETTSNPLSVAISQENEFLADYAGYEEVVWYVLDIPTGNNSITLSPVEHGFLRQKNNRR